MPNETDTTTGPGCLEQVVLPVRPGQETEFEAAFAEAVAIISAQPGFRWVRLSRSVEHPSSYLLLVEWDTVEAHVDGFRRTADYQRWRTLLHHFYDPVPVVEHFVDVDLGAAPTA